MTISFTYVDDLIFYSDHLVEHIRYLVCVRLCVRVFVSGGVDGCAGVGCVPPARGGGIAGRHMADRCGAPCPRIICVPQLCSPLSPDFFDDLQSPGLRQIIWIIPHVILTWVLLRGYFLMSSSLPIMFYLFNCYWFLDCVLVSLGYWSHLGLLFFSFQAALMTQKIISMIILLLLFSCEILLVMRC